MTSSPPRRIPIGGFTYKKTSKNNIFWPLMTFQWHCTQEHSISKIFYRYSYVRRFHLLLIFQKPSVPGWFFSIIQKWRGLMFCVIICRRRGRRGKRWMAEIKYHVLCTNILLPFHRKIMETTVKNYTSPRMRSSSNNNNDV